MNYRNFIGYLGLIFVTLFLLIFPYLFFEDEAVAPDGAIRVLTYSSFLQSWGAGPQIAKIFEQETGRKIHWINAGNAGLIIERLKFKNKSDKPDVVIGFDQFSIHEARKNFQWHDLAHIGEKTRFSTLPQGANFHKFLAYDWGPLTFIYKKNGLKPPQKLEDLTKDEYRDSIILQDPRMSSPGLQFFLWVLTDMGEEKGFAFLEQLRPSIKVMSPSWSSSYSLFKMAPSSMVFSYFTSSFFHRIEEKDSSYQAVPFDSPHPVQVEYVAVPRLCRQCDAAFEFVEFLLRPDIQKILMEKNYMFPVAGQALKESQFQIPENIDYYKPIESLSLIRRKRELINKWKKIFY